MPRRATAISSKYTAMGDGDSIFAYKTRRSCALCLRTRFAPTDFRLTPFDYLFPLLHALGVGWRPLKAPREHAPEGQAEPLEIWLGLGWCHLELAGRPVTRQPYLSRIRLSHSNHPGMSTVLCAGVHLQINAPRP